MKPTNETVLAYILKRHRSILDLHEKFSFGFSNEKKLRRILKELHLAGKIKYGRLPHKDRGMYLHAYVPEIPPEGIEIVGQVERIVSELRPFQKVDALLKDWEIDALRGDSTRYTAVEIRQQIFQIIKLSADD